MAKPKNYHVGGEQLPLVTPESSWKPPTELPDLRRMGMIAVDTEGRDDGIGAGRGSGWAYLSGFVSGVSAAWGGGSFYAPVRHPDTDNLDPDNVKRWLADHFACPDLRVVMHHASHDVGWLGAEWGLPCPAHLDDTEGMAVTVDENRLKYSLDSLCEWRGIVGKDETLLCEAAAAYGVDPKGGMWKLPARYVGPYAEQDAQATLALAKSLDPVLDDEGTRGAYRLEMDLVPMVREMRARGIRVDLDAAQRARAELLRLRDQAFADLGDKLGERVGMEEIGKNGWLSKRFDAQRIPYPRTAPTRGFPDGQPSFTAGVTGWMHKHPHWLPQLIVRADVLNNAAEKFVKGFILDYAHRGKLHASINQYRGEDGGTRTSRFSYSDPALQQIPVRDEVIGPMIRGCFVPEEGEAWLAADYSEQEYRLIVHFASLLGCRRANEAVQRYREDSAASFHQMVMDWTGLDRKSAKNTNFAKAYRAGISKFAAMIGRSEDEAREIYQRYEEELPFVTELAQECQRTGERRGWIRLLDGARLHFDKWEKAWRDGGYDQPKSLEEARAAWPGEKLRRAFCYQAMNALIQGSAARQVKQAMRACWREGLVPLLQMHDELDFSVADEGVGKRVGEIMRDVVRLEVPVKVDLEYGPSWGRAEFSFTETQKLVESGP